MPDSDYNVEVEQKKKCNRKEEAYFNNSLLLVRTLNRFGTHSQLIADYRDPIIPSAI